MNFQATIPLVFSANTTKVQRKFQPTLATIPEEPIIVLNKPLMLLKQQHKYTEDSYVFVGLSYSVKANKNRTEGRVL